MRNEGLDLVDQQPGFDFELGPNATRTVRVDSFSYEVQVTHCRDF